jgi:hypothetical protein
LGLFGDEGTKVKGTRIKDKGTRKKIWNNGILE